MVKRSMAFGLVLMLAVVLAPAQVFADEAADQDAVVKGNNQFACDLYRQLRNQKGNLFFSPFSISTALAMTYAGARGNTEKQMAETLHFTLPQDQLHPVYSELMQRLTGNAEKAGYELTIANALWGQSGYKFHDAFLDITKKDYGSGFREVDFIKNAEAARVTINQWVEEKTKSKIQNLLEQAPDSLTRLILTNAIYFKGKWSAPFKVEATKESPFTLLTAEASESIQVPTMHQQTEFLYTENDWLQVLEMFYAPGNLSMMVLLPKKHEDIARIEESCTAENLRAWTSEPQSREVIVSMPKFKMTSQFELSEKLQSLGMTDAFNSDADFSGMSLDPKGLFISKVIHKAFADVNEEGTEAAAATAVRMELRGISAEEPPKPVVFKADHPFVFIIQDHLSGSILFMGRVSDPRE